MSESAAISTELPCPTCGYDLRGQVSPSCSECGRTFASLEELRIASRAAFAVLNRVRSARQVIGVAILAPIILWTALRAIEPETIVYIHVALAVTVIVWCVSGVASLVLLYQVLRWMCDNRVCWPDRRRLGWSIPLLVLYSVPMAIAIAFTALAFLAR